MHTRNISRQVIGSNLVQSSSQVNVLAGFLNVPPQKLKLTMLFSSAVSGWNPSQFHASCDQKGATITLVSCRQQYYGGFASISWTSQTQWLTDSKAFLFRFKYDSTQKRVTAEEKFDSNGTGNHLLSRPNYGPVFGYKHDLFTFGEGQTPLSDVRAGGNTSFNVSSLFYNNMARNAGEATLEVLQVGTADGLEELEQPWLSGFPWSQEDAKKVQEKVFQYDPKQAGLSVPIINILLCGGVGAGKSSIVSTIDSICQSRISRRAPHGQGTGSLTRMLRKYTFVQPETKKPVKWQMWDSMGWGVDDYKRGELGFILDGNLPNKCDLAGSISTRTEGFKVQPSLQDRVHCMVLVVPCNAASDEAYMARLHEMRQFARDRELPTLVFLSKIDTYDPDVIGNDLAKTYHSSRLLHLVEELEETAGVGGRKDILPVKSLSNEMGPTTELSALMCKALEQALYAAEDYVTEYGDRIACNITSELSDSM
ncbi:Interferon-induced protein 44-like [Trebouxia sp. C0010 RCD-2024]